MEKSKIQVCIYIFSSVLVPEDIFKAFFWLDMSVVSMDLLNLLLKHSGGL